MKPLAILVPGLLAIAAAAAAQPHVMGGPPGPPDMTIDATVRATVIDTLLDRLARGYVFPEAAREMDKALRRRQQRREYDGITSAKVFAESLTAHLQAVSHDKHLRVRYREEALPAEAPGREPSPEERARNLRWLQARNYGFEKLERLRGNVGYLDLRNFMSPAEGAGETATAAMNFLGNCAALIVDLRQNGGGSPEMIQLLSTYLFPEGDPVHLNDLYFRPENQTTQFWTLPHVPGRRLAGQEVYVLTSQRTFSAAEEFTYNLKNLKRATIVGETTGGGAHPGGMRRLHEHFAVFVPSGRAINPISKTNWEGTGVIPDVPVAADQALQTAHVMAIRKLIEKSTDPEVKEALQDALDDVVKQNAAPAGGATGPKAG